MDRGAWQRLLETVNAQIVLRRIKRYKSRGRFLEVGIGNGTLIRAAKDAGYDCMGVEASDGLVRRFVTKSAIPVFKGYLESFAEEKPNEQFDIIVMNHVLEHIPSPLDALKQLRAILKDRGLVHIAVPNIDAWEANLPGWTAFELYHLYYFNPTTLASLAKQAGFSVTRIKTVERFSGWTNTFVRTLLNRNYQEMRLSGARNAPSIKQKVAKAGLEIARLVVGTATVPLRYLQSQIGRGEELIAILEKQ